MTSLRTPVAALSVGHPTYSQTFPCAPSTAELGRELVREVLGVWHLGGLADRAALIVTELIANASRHTSCSEIRLTVARPDATRLRVGVVDREPARLPILSQAADDDESGRGLLLVDAVADCWGYDLHGSRRRPWGKEVWAEFRTGGGE
ncbi:ATP-binding protein [Streptomyces demainii]|uniref:Anti-sigma regulatory factor (Ser/Thr protein kinase) n=1 Tax=Streptomyces demainii TaxID=588122 RepID=A0ABT9KHT3_9ACTN|nr:ATP-binding protein [Streptomyces demainii]MDP9607983.1 anti-sigma regulatory factor (Ser/Thr protein kinase) [Streptomyces demainii]